MIKGDLSTTTARQWLKMALIPSLVLVLVAVVCWPTKKQGDAIQTTLMTSDVSNKSATKPATVKPSKWPTMLLEEIVAFNPFDPHPVLPPVDAHEELNTLGEPTVSNEKQSTREALPRPAPSGTLQAVYFDAKGAAAILDSKVVRVGDVLPSGDRIVEITAQGIKLEGL